MITNVKCRKCGVEFQPKADLSTLTVRHYPGGPIREFMRTGGRRYGTPESVGIRIAGTRPTRVTVSGLSMDLPYRVGDAVRLSDFVPEDAGQLVCTEFKEVGTDKPETFIATAKFELVDSGCRCYL